MVYLDTMPTVQYGHPMTETGKRQIGPRIDAALVKQIQILAIQQDRGFNDVIEEALRDLLKKYRVKSTP